MTEIYRNLRSQLREHFIDYLKADHVGYWPPELTVCPKCHQHCSILFEQHWFCEACDLRGDVVDYVMINNSFDTPEKAIRHLCRMLGIKNTQFDVFSADEVMDMEFAEPTFLVDKLISNGLHILAGPSKSGKSWLALWMAHRISTGQPIWDFNCRPGEVLYLSLEDPLSRVQRRLVDVTDGHTGKIWIVTEAEMIGNGLEEQLVNFLAENPAVNFVLIDTLQKIRDMKSENYCYAGDYRTMSILKAIADRFHIAILLIHHTRKQPSADPFDMISGTTGLMGCADSSFVLRKDKRLSEFADFYGTGRDIEDLHFSLRFNLEEKCWDLVSSNLQDAEPPKHDHVLQLIRDFTKEKEEWKGTAAELLVELKNRNPGLDLTANVLIRIMNANSVMLRNFYKVSYHSLPKRNNMKRFSLRYLFDVAVENAVNADPSDSSDMSDNIGHIALIGLTGPTETN